MVCLFWQAARRQRGPARACAKCSTTGSLWARARANCSWRRRRARFVSAALSQWRSAAAPSCSFSRRRSWRRRLTLRAMCSSHAGTSSSPTRGSSPRATNDRIWAPGELRCLTTCPYRQIRCTRWRRRFRPPTPRGDTRRRCCACSAASSPPTPTPPRLFRRSTRSCWAWATTGTRRRSSHRTRCSTRSSPPSRPSKTHLNRRRRA
mmetsp:Transcript_33426/g.70336  ORF Transcript_33426/g.70336 Transcript_33426/m.70336 type:complete len:206 (+) Transcript_33426:540-1157(+)